MVIRHDLLEGDRLAAIDAEQQDAALVCGILACDRRVEKIEILGGFRVQMPDHLVGKSLPQCDTAVTLKILRN